ncbi:DNRLRE domain-containing protein [Planosporangium mesophilum]|nr:DNRLRE domain-containing protein [Planosporangium mesophilum]NJC85584.1 DNRLRE domain-containing protein [Planosporangium mesophilum]
MLPVAAIAIAVAGPLALGTGAFAATSTLSYSPTDDAYISGARVNLNTGAADKLVAGTLNGDRMVTYLKFKVGTLAAGSTVTGATVTLSRDEHKLPATVTLSVVPGTGWTEAALTRNNAPALGSVVATVNPSASAATVTFDVSKVITGAGAYAFAITSSVTNDVARFRSAEYGATGPQLKLTMQNTVSAPSPTPTKSVTPSPSPTASKPATPSPSPTVSNPATPSPSPTTAKPAECTVDAKLVPSCGVLWGAAAGGFSTTPRDQALKDWEAVTGRTASIYHTYHTGDQLFPTKTEIAMASDPARPRLLMPNWKVADGYTWAQVAAGAADARIDLEASYLKANYTKPFFLVIHHEPENDVNATAGSGMTAKDYAAMFRHVVDRLRSNGVTNAVATLTYMSYEKWNNMPWWYDLYPGDAWVDWITLDAYVNAQPGGFHYGDFNYLVNRTTNKAAFPGYYSWVTSQHPNKPFMVSEWGVFDYAADPTQKAAIYAKVLQQLKALPAIKGLMYFDAQNAPGAPGDLRVNSSPQSLTEFKKIAADPIFNVTVK